MRRAVAVGDAVSRLRRRLLGRHDVVGRATGWRAIYDEDEEVWDFYDDVGHYCVAVSLTNRPRPCVVDFIATIYAQGFEAGSLSRESRREPIGTRRA